MTLSEFNELWAIETEDMPPETPIFCLEAHSGFVSRPFRIEGIDIERNEVRADDRPVMMIGAIYIKVREM